jgi:hypothetical protein
LPAVVKDRIWPFVGYQPHPGQKEVHDSLARFRVLDAGRRFGKSLIGGRELVPEAALTHQLLPILQREGIKRRFWLAGPDYSDVDKEFRVLYDDLKRLGFEFDRPGTYYNRHVGDFVISLFDGYFEVEGKSAKNPDSMDGEGLFGVVLVEAAKLKASIWDKYLSPALMDHGGWALFTSTPEGKNWFYEKWQWGQDPDFDEWESWKMPSWRNTNLYPLGEADPEITSARKRMSAPRFAQEIEADFTDFVGRVFKDFDEEIHVADLEYHPGWPMYGAVDYGWTNPFIWLTIQMDPFGNLYVLDEYRIDHRDILDVADDLLQRPLPNRCTTFFPDPADSTGATSVLEKKLHVRANRNTGGPRKDRLEMIRQALRYEETSEGHPPEERRPKLLIDRKCYGLIREMLEYRYPETPEESLRAAPEEPLDKDNHAPEALGRFFKGYYGGLLPESEGGRARAKVKKAKVA